MKFITLIALFGGVSAIKLHQHHAKTLLKEMPSEADAAAELEEWAKAEFAKDGSITKEEAAAGAKEFAKKHGIEITDDMIKKAEAGFDKADSNGDGKIDVKEGKAARKAYKAGKALIKLMKEDVEWPELTEEQWGEIEAWVEEEFTTGDQTITKEEATAAATAFAKKHGFEITEDMAEVMEAGFDAADANGDGAIDLKEAMAAYEAHEKEQEGEGKKKKRGGKKGKSFLGLKEGPNLTEAQVAEIEAWVKEQLADGGTITKKEGEEAITAFAKKHGFQISEEMWEALEAAFDAADCNGDGELEAKEVKRAMKGKACKKGKKGGKGKSCNPDGVQFPELNEAQHKEIHDWVVNELSTGEKTITKDEARAGVTAFAKKHGFEITEDMGNVMECEFDKADTNNDGAISEAELRKAME